MAPSLTDLRSFASRMTTGPLAGDPFLIKPTTGATPYKQIDGSTAYVGANVPGAFTSAFSAAARQAAAAVFSPFNILTPAAGAVGKETQRVGESAREALTAGASGLKIGATIGTLLLILIVGLWALSTARRIAGGS